MSLRSKYLIVIILGILFEAFALLFFFNFYEKRKDTHLLMCITQTENLLIKSYHESDQVADFLKLIEESFNSLDYVEGYSLVTRAGEVLVNNGFYENVEESVENEVEHLKFNTFLVRTDLGLDHEMLYIIHPKIKKQDIFCFGLIIILIFCFMIITHKLFSFIKKIFFT